MIIDHIGIATSDLAGTTTVWCDTLGLQLDSTEEVGEQGVRVAMLEIGESHIELLEPSRADSPVARFLEKRGAGIHHLAIRVDDIESELSKLRAKGVRLIDESPRVGARGC